MTERTAPLYKAVLERIKEIYREKEVDKALDNKYTADDIIRLRTSDFVIDGGSFSGRSRWCWFPYGQVKRIKFFL